MITEPLVKVNKKKMKAWLRKRIGFLSEDILDDSIQQGYLKLLSSPKVIDKQIPFIMKVAANYLRDWKKNRFNCIKSNISSLIKRMEFGSINSAPIISSLDTTKSIEVTDSFQFITKYIRPEHLVFMLNYISYNYGEKKILGSTHQVRFCRLKKLYAQQIPKVY